MGFSYKIHMEHWICQNDGYMWLGFKTRFAMKPSGWCVKSRTTLSGERRLCWVISAFEGEFPHCVMGLSQWLGQPFRLTVPCTSMASETGTGMWLTWIFFRQPKNDFHTGSFRVFKLAKTEKKRHWMGTTHSQVNAPHLKTSLIRAKMSQGLRLPNYLLR